MVAKELLKDMRKEAGMSQKELSAYFGIPSRTIEDWERGIRKAPDYVIRLIVYKLRVEGLIDRHDEWEQFTYRDRE